MPDLIPEEKLGLLNQDVDAEMLTCEPIWAGFRDTRIKTQVGEEIPPLYGEVVKAKTINWYMEPTRLHSFVDKSCAALLSNKELMPLLTTETERLTAEITRYARDTCATLENKDLEGLLAVLERCRELHREISVYGLVIAFADIFGGITEANLTIMRTKGVPEQELSHRARLLSTPKELSMTEAAIIDIQRSKKDTAALLQEYFWLNQGYSGTGLAEKDLENIRSMSAQPALVSKPADDAEPLQFSKDELFGFEVAGEMARLKGLRADARQFLTVVTNRAAKLLAEKEFSIDFDLLRNLTTDELIDIARGTSELPTNLEERNRHSLFVFQEGTYAVLVGENVANVLNSKRITSHASRSMKASGKTAFPGVARGRARLVFNPQHIGNVEEGDVLITTATSPQMIPAMMRAVAFVTAVGGITSHAAIVAREMRKPCVVGVRDVMETFQNGDMIEVNADIGVVTRIS